MRCAFCGMNIKWGQERPVRDPRSAVANKAHACPTCCVEQGLWSEMPPPSEG